MRSVPIHLVVSVKTAPAFLLPVPFCLYNSLAFFLVLREGVLKIKTSRLSFSLSVSKEDDGKATKLLQFYVK